MIFIGDKIDSGQYGGQKGTLTTHYLIDMITYILYNQDLKQNQIHAVVTAMIDFFKSL